MKFGKKRVEKEFSNGKTKNEFDEENELSWKNMHIIFEMPFQNKLLNIQDNEAHCYQNNNKRQMKK